MYCYHTNARLFIIIKLWSTLDPVSDTTMSLSGLGDAFVGIDKNIRFTTDQFTHYLIPGLSLKLPTGITNIKDNAGEVFDPEIQPGTGTLDLLFEIKSYHDKWQVGFIFCIELQNKQYSQ